MPGDNHAARQHEEGPGTMATRPSGRCFGLVLLSLWKRRPGYRGDLRVQGRKGNFEDRHYCRAGEEADYSQRTLSDVVEIVRRIGRHYGHLLLREPSPPVFYGRLSLTFEDEQDLLSTVRVPSDVLFRVELEVDGRGACRPGLRIYWEVDLDSRGRVAF